MSVFTWAHDRAKGQQSPVPPIGQFPQFLVQMPFYLVKTTLTNTIDNQNWTCCLNCSRGCMGLSNVCTQTDLLRVLRKSEWPSSVAHLASLVALPMLSPIWPKCVAQLAVAQLDCRPVVCRPVGLSSRWPYIKWETSRGQKSIGVQRGVVKWMHTFETSMNCDRWIPHVWKFDIALPLYPELITASECHMINGAHWIHFVS